MAIEDWFIGTRFPVLGERFDSIDGFIHRHVNDAYCRLVSDDGLHLILGTDSLWDNVTNRRLKVSNIDSGEPSVSYWLQGQSGQRMALKGNAFRRIPGIGDLKDRDGYIQAAKDFLYHIRSLGRNRGHPYKVRLDSELWHRHDSHKESDGPIISVKIDDSARLSIFCDGRVLDMADGSHFTQEKRVPQALFAAIYLLTSKDYLRQCAAESRPIRNELREMAKMALGCYSIR